ncbi:MAG: chemotaxis protein CheX [Clostridiales bacterium]|nr:chemotaxis protein CheX [Clostridiales bacterium]
MDVKYINPFLQSFLNVLPQLGITNIKKSKISLKGKEIESHGVVIIVGVVGDAKGNVVYSTTTECAKKIASLMMMGMPVDELDDMAQSALSELANMLTATAATNFSQVGININISTPTLVHGDFVANTGVNQTVCIEMLVEDMHFEINVSLES